MKMKLLFVILFTAASFFAYAEESLDSIIKVMVDNIKIDNSKCVTIPGPKGVLRIYVESNKRNPHSTEFVVINYNDKQISFHAGNNFLITQDDNLVFGKYNNMVYAKKYMQPIKEHLKIRYNSFLYDYSSKELSVTVYDNEFTAKEVLYNRDESKFTIYQENNEVKHIELGI